MINTRKPEISFSLHKATVIHANKYSTAHDGGLNLPIWSNLHLEIVFRLVQSLEDLRIYVKNLNLPIYTGQEVSIVSVGNNVVAYVDMTTKNYYYTSRNYAGKLGLGIAFYWALIVGVVGGFLVYYFQRDQPTVQIFIPLIVAWLLYTIQKWIYHFRFKKQLDRFLTQ
jgi:hypothetical protein